ncbi:hypothetical protein MKK88_02615 [Methylobacterium sp. E-005]|uniref:hypothetical protein n=1 Tax=Methylobacterium sp. E-005 TaxID=2836549 RepID=UPI001FB98F06|nr:hypothetical protein [Methylobacterium sp. E-005]MCJ2084887.1 hypothetical protein [Methylobacterium sp. E-005]
MRHPVGRRSRGSATTGPGTKAGVRAGSRPTYTPSADPRAARAAADLLTDAEVLVGSTSWLLSLADWLTEELDLADGETVRLRRADVEKVRSGLIRCVACLDTLTCDPAQLPPLDDASPEAAPSPATPSQRTLQ